MQKAYSHPGKELKDHSFNVYQLGMKKLSRKNLNFQNQAKIKLVTEIVLISHDFGKATQFFQRKLELASQGKKDSKEYKKLTKQGNNKSSHSLLSALFTYYILDELVENRLLSLLGLIVVYRHHSDLKDFKDMLQIADWDLLEEQFAVVNLEELQEILDLVELEIDVQKLEFDQLKNKLDCYQFRKQLRRSKKILQTEENYLLLNLLYSILISSDKAEAIFYNKDLSYQKLENIVLSRKEIEPTAVDQYKQLKGWNNPKSEINKKRNQVYDEVMNEVDDINIEEDRILSLNVPTGIGKTITSLSAGLKLRERLGQNHRLIYTLPFTSIIDQNYDVFKRVLKKTNQMVDSSLMIKHHYLTPKSYIDKERYEDEEYDISKHLIESWNSEIIVTTFVQLLHSIFSNQNRSLLKFNNLANSIILLDEVQNIPHKYWKLIRVIFNKMARKLDCYFIFITATLPLIYNEQNNEIKELAVNKENHFNFFNRIKLDLSEFRAEKTLAEFKEFIEEELITYESENFLIVLNTIKTSIEVFNYIENLIQQEKIDGETVYLSTNIIPQARESRINSIGGSNQRQIIVSTQMVEAGVDIDLDRVYRDFAPLDSINQTCGRCNRNFESDKGVVTLVKLVNENHQDRSYASYIYSDILLTNTEKILAKWPDEIEEENFFRLNNDYFNKLDQVTSDDISNQLLEKIKHLKYKQAFWTDNSSEGKIFELIDQDFATVNLFIEINKEAEEVWDKYREICELEVESMEEYSRRKAEFEKIKREFLSYVITIPEEVAKKQLEEVQLEDTFNRIDNLQVPSVYNIDTGFKRNETEINTFF